VQKFDKTVIYILLVTFGLGYFLYLINDILTPFIAALVFSYFLAPLVDRLHKRKVPRAIGSIIVVCAFFGVFIILTLTISPIIYKQALMLSEKINNHSADIKILSSNTLDKLKTVDPEYVEKAQEMLGDFSGTILSIFGSMIGRILHSGVMAINIISILFITPIVMYYSLTSWGSFTQTCNNLIPLKYRKTSSKLFTDIDHTLSNFIRGQSMVCLILGVFYAISLSVIGVESGFALGVISGFLIFIPYVGALFSSVLCMLIAAIQFGEFSIPLLIGAIFAFGQTVESNFLTPNLIGKSVGLNPVWIIFGLLAGGALMGLLGVLIALPLTAAISVIIKFALKQYKQSKFYK